MPVSPPATALEIKNAYGRGLAAAADDGSDDPGQHYIDVNNIMMVHAFRTGYCAQKIAMAHIVEDALAPWPPPVKEL
jgi:hypothetical protein